MTSKNGIRTKPLRQLTRPIAVLMREIDGSFNQH